MQDPQESQGTNIKQTAGIAAVVGLLVIGVVAYALGNGKKPQGAGATPSPTSSPTQTAQSSPTAPASSVAASGYKDGTYGATGDYRSPGGPRQIGVSLTFKGGVITDAIATPTAEDATSQNFQNMFASNFKPLVVGKKIDEVSLDRVSGSSLTPGGFNDALAKIKSQAKA